MLNGTENKDGYKAGAHKSADSGVGAAVQGRWFITCRDKTGAVKWQEEIKNLVVDEGLNYLLDAGLSAGTPVTAWYVGLTGGTPTPAANDTMATHAGWTEVTAYSEGVRQTWTDGGVSSKSVSNSASPARFTISSDGTTVGGAFLTSSSTKGGSTGTLYAVGAFSAGNKLLDTSDTLDVTATFTQAAA